MRNATFSVEGTNAILFLRFSPSSPTALTLACSLYCAVALVSCFENDSASVLELLDDEAAVTLVPLRADATAAVAVSEGEAMHGPCAKGQAMCRKNI